MRFQLSRLHLAFLFLLMLCAVAPAFAQEVKALDLNSAAEKNTLTLEEEETPAESLPEAQVKDSTSVAVLRALNKVTARTSDINVAPNTIAHFGNLEILMIKCWKSPPEEKPEAAALMQIWEKRPNELRQQVFLGWMFASSPALSALEHAVYDIRVMDCIPPEKTKQ